VHGRRPAGRRTSRIGQRDGSTCERWSLGPVEFLGGCVPISGELWDALDRFHLGAVACIREQLASNADREAQRLVLRRELDTSQTFELFDRLSAIVVRRLDRVQSGADPADPLLAACQVVAETLHTTLIRPSGRRSVQQTFDDVVEIARASRLRVRQTLLRGDWWTQDVDRWCCTARGAVALVRSGKRCGVAEPKSGTHRLVGQAVR
jgi:hypothetical protein